MKEVILLKSGSKIRGGLEKYTEILGRSFLEAGAAVKLLTSGSLSDQNYPFEAISLAPRSKMSYQHLIQFDAACKKYLEKISSDIVFGLDRNSYQTHYRAGNGVHAAYLKHRAIDEGIFKQLSFQFNPLHRKILALEKKTYESPHLLKLFTNSNMVKEEILTHYQTPAEKIHVVFNGVDLRETEAAFEESLKRTSSTHQFLFVGHGWQRKGLLYLIQALSYMRGEPWHLTVVGKERNPMFYQSTAETLGIRHKISFLGQTKNIIPYLQQADTLVIPTMYDPFANVTIEGLAMGLFVVTSEQNGAKELIQEGLGLVSSVIEPELFSRSLKKAMEAPKNYDQAVRIRTYCQQFTLEKQVEKIIYETLAN